MEKDREDTYHRMMRQETGWEDDLIQLSQKK